MRGKTLHFLLGTMAFLLTAGAAHAQQTMLPMALAESFQPEYTRRDLAVVNEVLALDAAQKPLMDSLFADHEAEFRRAAERARQEIDAVLPLAAMDDEARNIREQEVRVKVQELIELAQKLSREVPPGPEGDAAREAQQQRVESIRRELDEIHNQRLEADDMVRALAAAQPVVERWQAQKAALSSDFVTGVQAMLTPEQLERWPALERRLRRDRTLPRGKLSGESVNLIQLVQQVAVPETVRAAVEPLLNQYELQLDEALRERNAQLDKSNQAWFEVMQAKDHVQAAKLAQEQVRSRVRVRNINDAYAHQIAANLRPELAAQFTGWYRSRAYPRVFRMSQAQRLLAAAQELPGVEPTAVEALRTMEQQYLAEIGPVNERLVLALRKAEPIELQLRLVRVAVGGEEDPDPDVQALENAFDERTEFGDRFIEKLEGLLTQGQLKLLPRGAGLPSEPN